MNNYTQNNAENQQPKGLEATNMPKWQTEKLAQIDEKHLQDFRDSSIDGSIIALNFTSLNGEIGDSGSDVGDHLLYSKDVPRKNDGNITAKHAKYQRLGVGWWCSNGYDLETLEPMPNWGCFKPDEPQIDKDGKSIKYETPPCTPAQYFALRVTFAIGTKLAQRYSLETAYTEHQGESSPSDEDKEFWGWAIGQKSIPLLITEGAKKAACLLSHGYLSIAIPGIWMACEKDTDTLKPGIAAAATGREIVIAFDMDSKEKTQKAVNSAAVKLSRACIVAGAIKVTQSLWAQHFGKGVDDFITKKGIQMFDTNLEDREEVRELPKNGLQDTHKGNPCPVCGDTSGKCSTGLSRTKNKVKVEDGVLCASTLIEDNIPDGWEFKGLSKNGLGKLHPATPKKSGSKKKNESQFSSSIDKGLTEIVKIGGQEKDVRVANHLKAIANVTTPEGEGVVLEFAPRRGSKIFTTILYREDLAGEGLGTLRALARQGYDWEYHQKDTLLEALHQLGRDEIPDATITNKTGWHEGSYVTSHKTYGDQSIRFGSWEVPIDAATEIVGKLAAWQGSVGAKCEGNSRLTLALAAAFCAPLIRLLETAESGGVHIYGSSSEGKTTSAKVAISVTGEKVVQTWNQTINALEGTAEAHSDSLMVLDELHQCSDPKKAGAIIYQLANEEGKGRGKPEGGVRKTKNWKISYLSTGEKSVPEFLKAYGVTIKAGQEVRMPSIPASPYGAPFGCFETIHGAKSPEQFALDLEAACAANRGVAGDAFLSRLVVEAPSEEFRTRMVQRIEEITEELIVGIENNAVKRIARKRFALYQCAIELAINYGIVPFSKKSAAKSIKKCFQEWLNDRGGDGSRDVKEAVANFLQVIERNLLTNRVYDPCNSDRALVNVLGYWIRSESGEGELCIPLATFESEFCKEVKKEALIKELQRLEILFPGTDGKSTLQRRPEPGSKTRKRYLVVNLETRQKNGESGERGESASHNAVLETLLAGTLSTHSVKTEVSQVSQEREEIVIDSPDSPAKKESESRCASQEAELERISGIDSPDSLDSPKKQGTSQKTEKFDLTHLPPREEC